MGRAGRVLGRVAVLAAMSAGGADAAARPLDAAVLYSAATPAMGAALPTGRVERLAIEGFRPRGRHAETVVVAGHSLPPRYLDRPADEVARAIVSFSPSLIVLDTCYGASLPLLEALAEAGSRARVVAPAFRLPESGFVYAPDLFRRPDAAARAAAVRSASGAALLNWAIAPAPLAAARSSLRSASKATLRRRLRNVEPPLVRVPLAGAGWVLAPVAPERVR